MLDPCVETYGPHVKRAASPNAEEAVGPAAREGRPSAAVPVQDDACPRAASDGPDIVAAAAPQRVEIESRAARHERPGTDGRGTVAAIQTVLGARPAGGRGPSRGGAAGDQHDRGETMNGSPCVPPLRHAVTCRPQHRSVYALTRLDRASAAPGTFRGAIDANDLDLARALLDLRDRLRWWRRTAGVASSTCRKDPSTTLAASAVVCPETAPSVCVHVAGPFVTPRIATIPYWKSCAHTADMT